MAESNAHTEAGADMVELIVMLHAGHNEEDAAPLAESVKARVLEVRTMFDHKVVALIAIAAELAESTLSQLQHDDRVELAQFNRIYKHC
ncbi:MAG: hypothetical protein P4L53_25665 [Candidatus Obscuribacterales bacterium]|nr:hypothetical protein [Candidatus Obscuribacterales bacterium]